MRAIFRICGNESQPDLPPCFWKVVRTTSDKQIFKDFSTLYEPRGKSSWKVNGTRQLGHSNGKFPGAMEDLKR